MARILIVEDEHVLERIFTMNLVGRGHTVAEAESLTDSFALLQAADPPFDLVLLDINLPDGSGWDLLRLMRARQGWQAPPVIVVTAIRPTRQRLDDLAPAAVLVKPFPIGALLQLIERVLNPGEENGSQAGSVSSSEGSY